MLVHGSGPIQRLLSYVGRHHWGMLATALVLATGSAYAAGALPNSAGDINACYVKKGTDRGELRLLAKGKCTRQERRLVWSQQGPPGEQGAPGEPGPAGVEGPRGLVGATGEPGQPATRLFARVSGTGTLLSGSPGASAVALGGAGDYEVSWGSQNLTNCAVDATIESGAFGQGLIRRSVSPTAANKVRILTQDTAGTQINNGFAVVAFC